MKKVITTVGTSLIENANNPKKGGKGVTNIDESDFGKTKTYWQEWKSDETSNFQRKLHPLKQSLRDYFGNYTNIEISAEIKSLVKIQEQEKCKLEVYLICTDTILSVIAADMICEWFEKYDADKQKFEIKFEYTKEYIIEGLQVDDPDKFEQEGLSNLIEKVESIIDNQQNIIINISGGFKANIPILTILGQLHNIDTKYIYEDSAKVITTPKLTIDFDFTIFEDNILAFEAIKPNKQLQNLPDKASFLADLGQNSEKIYLDLKNAYLIIEDNQKIKLTTLGKILYKHFEDVEKEQGFGRTNMIGKIMELQVYQFLKNQLSNSQVELGKFIGTERYDIDVYAENNDTIYGIEVKPTSVKIGGNDKETIQYKLEVGAFKHLLDKATQEQKALKLFVFMYHHKEIHPKQIENFENLLNLESNPCKEVSLVWLKPVENYKKNVNWNIGNSHLKIYDFENSNWKEFEI